MAHAAGKCARSVCQMLFAICCPPDACCRSIRQKREANGRCNFESPMLSLTRSGLQSGATAIAAAAPSWAMARGAAARPHRLDKSRLRRICECPQDCRSQGPRCNPRTNTCSTPLLTRWKFVPLLAVKMFPSCRVFHERHRRLKQSGSQAEQSVVLGCFCL